MLVAVLREECHVGGAFRERDGIGRRRVDRTVVLVDEELVTRAEDFRGAEELLERAHERWAADAGPDDGGGGYDAAPA